MHALIGKWASIVGLGILLNGCAANLRRDLVVPNLAQPAAPFVVDATTQDEKRAFLAAEGNIYSCWYGIHQLSQKEFTPPKAKMFESMLAGAVPEVVTHRVVLERFDVFHNVQGNLSRSARTAASAVLYMNPANYIVRVDPSESFWFERDPYARRGGRAVGCMEGEDGSYFERDVITGHAVIVVWVKFRVDDVPFAFKSYYQHQAIDKASVAQATDVALKETMQGVAEKLRAYWSGMPMTEVAALRSTPPTAARTATTAIGLRPGVNTTPISQDADPSPSGAQSTPPARVPEKSEASQSTEVAKPWAGGKWRGW
ncbi:hypothetical protein [Stenotrophomonas humi]|nr:hypothetical protein [Stenotrophomonas humi]